MPSSSKPAWLQADKRQTKVNSFPGASSVCSKCLRASSEYGRTHSKHPLCSHFLHTCQSSYSPQRYQMPNHLNDLVMNKPAFFKHNQAGTCVHHPHKSNKVWPHLPVAFVKIVDVCSALAHISHVPISLWSK
jgi:hypothetical protein